MRLFLVSIMVFLNASGFSDSEVSFKDWDVWLPGQIYNDPLYQILYDLAKDPDIKHVLDIGASTGEGSSDAFFKGIKENPNNPNLYCLELSQVRFDHLKKKYRDCDFVKCYQLSSVALESFAKREEVIDFFHNIRAFAPNLNEALRWLEMDTEYVLHLNTPQNGIDLIKQENGVENFDIVLIDGSEFTGMAELNAVYGARYIILDDTLQFKNYYTCLRLQTDPQYTQIGGSNHHRNGFAVFRKNDFK